MQATRKNLSDTKVQLKIVADQAELDNAKQQTLRALAKDMRLPGFRAGKAPLNMVEKSANPNVLQQEFLDRVMNTVYGAALDAENLRPVDQPQVTIKKFVPFSELEIEAEVDVIGEMKLADYKKIKLPKEAVKVTAKDVDEVIEQLRSREADKKDAERAAKDGDQVVIDFAGTDSKTKEPVSGADGKDYPLTLGSNTFIPGFEPELIGLKAGDEKTFDVKFPKDYGVAALQDRKLTFQVTVKQVVELVKPKLDEEFAAKIGPFKDVEELKADVRKQLESEKQYQAEREYDEKLLNAVADKSTVAMPDSLIDRELDRMEADERQNLAYRGQTWQEHLEAEGLTEEEHRAQNRDQAERRVKAGLVLANISEAEGIDVTNDELSLRINILKGQYQDKAMQAELDKPENRREIASRILTEKTLEVLKGYASDSKASDSKAKA